MLRAKEIESKKFWTVSTVAKYVGFSDPTIRKLARDPNNDFPSPVNIGAGVMMFVAAQIIEWVNKKMNSENRKAG